MQRKFITNLLFLVLVNLLVKPFWIFGIDREVQNVIGAQGYGSYYAMLNLSIIFNILLDAGITNYNNRNISQHGHLLGKYFPGLVGIRILLGIGYMVICLIIAIISDYSREQTVMLSLLCFNQFLLSGILFLRSNLAGLHLFRTDSLISVTDRFLMIVLCGAALWTEILPVNLTIRVFVILQTIAYSITALIAFGLVLKHTGRFVPTINLRMIIIILRKSFPYALLILLMSIYTRQDPVLLETLHADGARQAGIYAQAYRLLDAGNMFAYLFAVLLLPIFARMIKQKQDLAGLTQLAIGLLMVPATVVALVAWFYSGPIMEMLYVEEVENSRSVLVWLMLAFVPMAGSYVVGTLLTANGSLRILNRIALLAVFISVSLNVWLIPEMGALGPAKVAVFVQSMVFIIQSWYVSKTFRFAPDTSQIIRSILLIICSVLIGTLIIDHIDNWMIGACLLAAVSTILSIIFKLIKPLEVLEFLKPENR